MLDSVDFARALRSASNIPGWSISNGIMKNSYRAYNVKHSVDLKLKQNPKEEYTISHRSFAPVVKGGLIEALEEFRIRTGINLLSAPKQKSSTLEVVDDMDEILEKPFGRVRELKAENDDEDFMPAGGRVR